MSGAGRIRVGIGGWTYEPWRGTFYPDKLPHARELEHAAGRVTAIEVNGTFYGRQKPETFEKWAAAVPDDFVFTVKASRYCVNRRQLAEAGESIERFMDQGLTRLGAKLGPILWQFAATKAFDPEDFAAFLDLLPRERDGIALRHVLEPRHESFRDPRFIDLARDHGTAIVVADGKDRPLIPDETADFAYARLQDARAEIATGYPADALDRWAHIAGQWASGQRAEGLPYVEPRHAQPTSRDVFVFFINGAKVRAPAAAEALIDRIGKRPA